MSSETRSATPPFANKSPCHGRRFLLVTLISLALMFMLFVPVTLSAKPGIQASASTMDGRLEPEKGPAGTRVSVTGDRFIPGEPWSMGGTALDIVWIDDHHMEFTVPSLPPGEYHLELPVGKEILLACCFEVTGGQAPTKVSNSGPFKAEPCEAAGMNIQCNDFGRISMLNKYDIRGTAVSVPINVTLATSYPDLDTRWIMFSVRNTTEDGANPVMIRFDGIHTPFGELVTSNVENHGPHEMAVWVHMLDVPIGVPITLDITVGASERGAFLLEAIVMAFDRGYEPVLDQGKELSLYSSSMLGVNKETNSLSGAGGKSQLRIGELPSIALVPGALVLLALVVLRYPRKGA